MGGLKLTKDEKIRLALKWLEPLANGERPYTYSELAKLVRKDRKTVSESILIAFSEGWVNIVSADAEVGPDPYRNRNQGLESVLRRRYSTLKEAIVLNVSSKRPIRETANYEEGRSDSLHELLGKAMARFVVETVGFDLREGESFGFGSGRGVYHTVRHVGEFTRKREPIRVRDLTLVSLCGNCQVKSESPSPILDANYNANSMAGFGILEGPYAVKPVMAESIAPQDIGRLRMEASFSKWPPDIALLGVGVLTGGHRFVNVEEIQDFVGPVLNELRKLNELTRKLRRPAYCPVGDICNYLFQVPKPSEVTFSEQERQAYDRIGELVEIVNKKLLTIQPQDLAAQNTRLLLVAGGEEKAPAIRLILGGPFGLNVVALCTDRSTAVALSRTEGE